MKCSRNDNEAKHLRKCASVAVRDGEKEDDFVKQFRESYHAAARAAYKAALDKLAEKIVKDIERKLRERIRINEHYCRRSDRY